MRAVRFIFALLLSIGSVAWAAEINSSSIITPPPLSNATVATTTVNTANTAPQIWNLEDADIRAVIQTMSQLTGKNFVIDPRVQGHITLVSSKPLSVSEVYQVFLSMLQVLNYAAIPSGNVIKIVPVMQAREFGGTLANGHKPAAGDEVVVRVIPVDNVSAEQLIPVLRPLMPEWANISAYTPSNSLILAGAASNIDQLVKIVKDMDNKNASTIQMIHLRYANAKKLVDVIKSLQDADRAQGKVTNVALAADEQNNSILISGNLTNRSQLRKLIAQLDTSKSTGSSNVVVVHLRYLSAKELAPILTNIAQGRIAEQLKTQSSSPTTFGVGNSGNTQVSIQAEEDDNAVIISAPREITRSLTQTIAQLDGRPKQVLVQAIIVRVDEGFLKNFGFEWGYNSGNTNSLINVPGVPNPANLVTAPAGLSGSFQQGVGVVSSGNFQVVINALLSNSSNDVLATPSVLVLNNKEATIMDGENVGIVNRSYAVSSVAPGATAPTDFSTAPFNTIERKDIALTLKVTPQIAPNNTVRLNLTQEDNSLGADVTAAAAAAASDNPTYRTSKIDTSVLVNSGDMLVLGGLISDDNEETIDKVPILGDIPLIGRLFQNKHHQIKKKNLMVFIRPIILSNRKQGIVTTDERYNFIRYQELRKKAGLGMDQSSQQAYPVLPDLKGRKTPLPAPFDP